MTIRHPNNNATPTPRSLTVALLSRTLISSTLISTTLISTTLLLTACGGGGNSADPVATPPQRDLTTNDQATPTPDPIATARINVSGKVLQVGYVSNAQVCFDSNDNTQCDSGEPTDTTDANGDYALEVPTGKRGANLLALITPAAMDSRYATTGDGSNPIKQGWVLAFTLEYDAGATALTRNISPLTSAYLSRMMSNGRNRLNNKNSVLTRSGKLDDYSLGADYDYVQTAPVGLEPQLIALVNYLSSRADTTGAPGSLIDTMAVMNAWYNTFNQTTTPIMDISKLNATTLATALDTYGYRYFHFATDASAQLRDLLVDNGGWTRDADTLTSLTSQGMRLSGGKIVQTYEHWENGAWTEVSYPDAEFLTLGSNGSLVSTTGSDALLPRDILEADGNLLTYRMAGTQVRYRIEIGSDVLSNYYLEDWLGPQLSTTSFGYSVSPATQPTCASSATQPTVTAWFNACRGHFADLFLEEKGGIKAIQNPLARAEYYDVTQLDALLKFPLRHPLSAYQDCAAAGRAEVTVAGKTTCNWMGDASTTHTLEELFAPAGVTVGSWTLTNANSTPASVPRQPLTLTLNADGTGALSGIATANVAAQSIVRDVTPVTEAVIWERHPQNANIILLSWPKNAADQTLPGHFSITGFSMAPSTDAAPHGRKLAITVQEGVFLMGQHIPAGNSTNYRYFNKAGLTLGIDLLTEEINQLFNDAGFQ